MISLYRAVRGNAVQKAFFMVKFWLRWQKQQAINQFFLWAVKKQYHEIVFTALEMGADTNTRYPGGNSALHFAVCRKDMMMVTLLTSSFPNLDVVNHAGWTPFRIARENKLNEIGDYLVLCGATA